MKRRKFLLQAGAATAGLALFQTAFGSRIEAAVLAGFDDFQTIGDATGKVLVIGGGMAGTTAAKYLRLWGGTGLKVTLIEPNATYYSNIFSNMVLTGERSLSQLAFNYEKLKTKYGVSVITSSVTSIDPVGKKVTLKNGTTQTYDRLVLAPGIDFLDIPTSGSTTNKNKIVHAWKAGTQTTSLKSQIQSMSRADTFIITIPPKPFRCPPGPYERACVVADYLKRVKGGGKVLVLDANPGIQAEVENFTRAFNETHKSIITYVPNTIVNSIDANLMTLNTNKGKYSGKVINLIPTHKAGSLISQSTIGLNNTPDKRWSLVNVLTYESTAHKFIHIIGDASSTTQPKAGHIANAEAKVCADAIIQLLKGKQVNQKPVTNSSCFTPITKNTASWLSVVFKYDAATGTMVPTGKGVTESQGANSENYEDMLKWFNNLMADTFA